MAGMDPMTRRRAKAINFGIIYGISGFGLARQLGITPGQARTYIDAYFARYPGIRTYMERAKEEARINGYVTTPFGRRCWVPGIADKNPARRAYAERQAINAPLQGGAADIIKKAMIRLPKALADAGLRARLLLQVHDELLFEAPEDEVAGADRSGATRDGECGDAVSSAGGGDRRRPHLGRRALKVTLASGHWHEARPSWCCDLHRWRTASSDTAGWGLRRETPCRSASGNPCSGRP